MFGVPQNLLVFIDNINFSQRLISQKKKKLFVCSAVSNLRFLEFIHYNNSKYFLWNFTFVFSLIFPFYLILPLSPSCLVMFPAVEGLWGLFSLSHYNGLHNLKAIPAFILSFLSFSRTWLLATIYSIKFFLPNDLAYLLPKNIQSS